VVKGAGWLVGTATNRTAVEPTILAGSRSTGMAQRQLLQRVTIVVYRSMLVERRARMAR